MIPILYLLLRPVYKNSKGRLPSPPTSTSDDPSQARKRRALGLVMGECGVFSPFAHVLHGSTFVPLLSD